MRYTLSKLIPICRCRMGQVFRAEGPECEVIADIPKFAVVTRSVGVFEVPTGLWHYPTWYVEVQSVESQHALATRSELGQCDANESHVS